MRFWKSINPGRQEKQKVDLEDLISILLPIYNAQEVLSECLNSILAQTHSNFEVIAVDDGSTDDSPFVLSTFARQDARICAHRLTPNHGVVKTLNYGLKRCRGNWIARMDADDIMIPERLQIQLAYLKSHPAVDLLGARVRIFRRSGDLTPGQSRYQDWSNSLITDQSIKSEIFAESPIMHPTFFLRKCFYENMGGYHSNPWAEDYDFILRAYLKNATFAKITEVAVAKRDSPERVARTDPRCKRKAMFQAKAHYFAQRNWLKYKRKLLIVGAGSSGRKTLAALKKERVVVHGFLDNNPSEANRTVAGLPAFTLNEDSIDRIRDELRDSFMILCVGDPEGLIKVRNLLEENDFRQGRDYIRFI